MNKIDTPRAESWNLQDLYASDDEFRQAKQRLLESVPALDRLQGRLGESAANLAETLEEIAAASRTFARLRCYSALKSDADTRISANQAMRQEVELLATELSGKIAYLRPEILTIDAERIEQFIAEEPRLVPHAQFLRDLLRQRAHVLGRPEERIMAEASLLTRDASSLFQVLNNVELPRGEVELHTGKKVRLNPVNFAQHRSSPHRPDRLKLFPEYFQAYTRMKDSLGQNLFSAVKAHLFRTRVRGYDSCLAAALNPDNVPLAVYHNLVRQVREHLPVLHRYFRLRARALGLERLGYPDLYCPLVASRPATYSTADATRLAAESLEPLGPQYLKALGQAFEGRWVDWHPAPGKRSGAYATGWAYDVHPYVLLNFVGDYESVSTLLHEMGHAMHSHFSNLTQPFPTADYSIFVAEVASTVNEALLIRHMLAVTQDRNERQALLGSHLDGIRGTLFRQTMFAEFELTIHELAERGEVLTGERLNELYLKLLREYHGHDEGVVEIADEYAVEWAAIPHMYFDFYVYQYATGIVAAQALSEALISGEDGARERYLRFLGSGGSDYPLELLRGAGVDLESPAPYEAALRGVQRQLDVLEESL